MYWAGNTSEERADLVEVSKIMTADWYARNIHYNHFMPYPGLIGFEKFILMLDCTHVSTVYFVEQHFLEVNSQNCTNLPGKLTLNSSNMYRVCSKDILEDESFLHDPYNNCKTPPIMNGIKLLKRLFKILFPV